MAESDSKPSEAIGYGRPPSARKYQPGTTGNPRGRPRGSQNALKVLRDVLSQTVSVKEQGKTQNMTKGEALIKVIFEGARRGDRFAANAGLALIEKLGRMTPRPPRDPKSQAGIMLVPGTMSPEEWKKALEDRHRPSSGPVTRAPKGPI